MHCNSNRKSQINWVEKHFFFTNLCIPLVRKYKYQTIVFGVFFYIIYLSILYHKLFLKKSISVFYDLCVPVVNCGS